VGIGPEPSEGGSARPPGLSPFQRALAGAFIGILYAGGSIARGYVAAGLVGGALAAILTYLVLKRYAENRRRR
jgi:hypothetical protein